MQNPNLTLETILDLESKIRTDNAEPEDYETLDFFVSSTGGPTDYLKKIANENGIRDFREFIRLKDGNKKDKIQLSKIEGAIDGVIEFLKQYTIQNKYTL